MPRLSWITFPCVYNTFFSEFFRSPAPHNLKDQNSHIGFEPWPKIPKSYHSNNQKMGWGYKQTQPEIAWCK